MGELRHISESIEKIMSSLKYRSILYHKMDTLRENLKKCYPQHYLIPLLDHEDGWLLPTRTFLRIYGDNPITAGEQYISDLEKACQITTTTVKQNSFDFLSKMNILKPALVNTY